MGSSKLISTRELFYIVLLLHQGGVFWVLPYLLVKENGTASLVSLLSGLLLGALIIAVCAFWGSRCRETTFIPSLTQLLGKPLGKIVGLLFVLFYAAFAVISLYTCIEVIGGQLLLETPRTLLICTVFLLVGWLSWNGLEDMARLTVLCVVLVAAILLLALAGSVELFSVENLLPLELRSVDDVQPALLHSAFAYSGLMILFMIYPALNQTRRAASGMLLAMVVSTGIFVVWVLLALGVFGQFSTGSMIWLPLELARMIRISSFLERTEALFAVLWLAIVFVNSSLLLWSVSESLHQLLERQKNRWLHWGLVTLLALACMQIKDILRMFALEWQLARGSVVLLPLLLVLVLAGSWLYGRRKGGAPQ